MRKKKSKNQMAETNYTVFSKKNCSFCDRAIMLIEDKGYKVQVKKIDEVVDHFQEMREKAPSMKTMPVVFKDEILIGGYSDLVQHFSNNA